MLFNLNKEDGVNRKEDQGGMDPDPDEEDMEDVRLDDEREHHWRMVLEDNCGGVDNDKSFLPDKRWYVYMKDNKSAY